MKVIEHLFRNNFAFYSFLGITYIAVFTGVNYSVAAISDINRLTSIKERVLGEVERTENQVSTLAVTQLRQNREIASIESRIEKATKQPQTYDDIVKKRIWGKDEIRIFCRKLVSMNPGFKCPDIPD